MSDDEPEFDGPEDEISNDEAEEEERQAWNEIAEQAHENEEHMSEIAEKEFGGTDNSTEPSEELDLISKIIQEKSNLLNDDSLTPDQKDLIQQELFTLRILERKVVGEPEEKIEYDRDFNAYRFARAASILSLESSWKEIELKMNLLVQKITKTSLEYDKIIALKSVLETFEKDYINLIIDSEKPKTKQDNNKFESKIFHRIIIDSRQLFSDFHNVFIGNVTFHPKGLFAHDTRKLRAFMLDLRSRKNKNGKEIDYSTCDLRHGLYLSGIDKEKSSLYQGYWSVDQMLTELRNHEEHSKKGDDNIKYLKNELNRSLSDPITGAESSGNFFILINILFLISYFFIEIMQTWVDTDEFLK